MSLFIPGMHWQVDGQVIDFDASTQKGRVQLIGVYGKDPNGNPIYLDVEADPLYASRSPFLQDYLDVKASYTKGEWVVVLGVPGGPTGPENPNNLLAGIPQMPYRQNYFIIGSIRWKNESRSRLTETVNKQTNFLVNQDKDFSPPPENFDHSLQQKLNGSKLSFPPITYEYLPHEDPSGGTT